MSTIITRNSATSGSVPSSLVQGELAINVTNNRLFFGSGSGNAVKEFGVSASYALSASYAQTASYLNTLNQDLTFNGNLTLNGTASIAFLNVTYESASVIYSSGSNQFGDASNDVQTLWGTVDVKTGPVLVTGSLNVTGSANITNQLSASSGHFATRAQIGELGTEQSSVKINGLTFNSNLKVSDLSNSNAAQTILHKHSTTAAPIVVGARSNSDTTSHGAVINDMPTLSIYGAGWTSGTYSLNGQINVGTDDTGTISGTSSPGKIEFWTTPNGTIWPEMAMKIDSNKKLTVSGSVQATSFTGSLQGTSSYATQALSSSYATTSSYVNPLNQTVEITGSLQVQNSIDSSLRFLFDSTGTASLDWEDGYLYNGSGSISADWKDRKLYDSNVDNSVDWNSRQLFKSDGTTVTLNWETGAFTGSMLGTASYAAQALSSSYAVTASYVKNAQSASYVSGSVVAPGLTTQIVYNSGSVLGADSGFVYSGSSVGIGTSVPTAPLHVVYNPALTNGINIDGTANSLNHIAFLRSGVVYGRLGVNASTGEFRWDSPSSYFPTIYSNGVEAMRISTNRNVLIGTTSDLARLQVRGSGATSATTALRVENSNASSSLVVLDNGFVGINTGSAQYNLDVSGSARFVSDIRSITGVFIGTTATFGGIFPASAASNNGLILRSNFNPTDAGNDIIFTNAQGDVAITTSTRSMVAITRGFNPTSGNGNYNFLNIEATINQTGGASGISRGIFIRPTLTSAFDFRAIETTTGSVIFNGGNVGIGKTPTSSLDVAGTTRFSGSFNTAISGSILTVIGSGSAQPIFTVQGSQGELFSITDSLSGSGKFTSGLTVTGSLVITANLTLSQSSFTNQNTSSLAFGTQTISTNATGSFTSAFYNYTLSSGSNARAGQVMTVWNGGSIQFTDVTTTDIGSTNAVALTASLSGANVVLSSTLPSSGWNIKTVVNLI